MRMSETRRDPPRKRCNAKVRRWSGASQSGVNSSCCISFSNAATIGSPGGRESTALPSPPGRPPARKGLRLGLIGVDRRLLFHGQPDVVEAVHQAVLAERIDLEFHLAAVRAADLLVGKVDGQRRIGAALGIVE